MNKAHRHYIFTTVCRVWNSATPLAISHETMEYRFGWKILTMILPKWKPRADLFILMLSLIHLKTSDRVMLTG